MYLERLNVRMLHVNIEHLNVRCYMLITPMYLERLNGDVNMLITPMYLDVS